MAKALKRGDSKVNIPRASGRNPKTLRGLDVRLSFKEIHFHAEFMPLAAFWGVLALLASILIAVVFACLF
jgi:hypothetical protein